MNLYEDRISDFLDACHRAGIKDPVRYLISKRIMVFDWLRGAFPRDILPTDVDGEVEINRSFLRLEFKDESALREGHVPRGQRKALCELAKTGFFTVFVIGVNEDGDPRCTEIFRPDGTFSGLIETDKAKIRQYCKVWSDRADNQQRRAA